MFAPALLPTATSCLTPPPPPPPPPPPRTHHQADDRAALDAAAAAPRPDSAAAAAAAGSGDAQQQPEASTSGRDASSSSSSNSSSSSQFAHLPREALAAMALSPLAALSLPMAASPEWRAAAASFADRVRGALTTDAAAAWWRGLDERLTYMDWTFDALGVDLSRVWDPDLWMRLKTAVKFDEPRVFWDALWDRIEFRSKVPDAGFAGDMRISYAKFLQLLEANRVKRLVVLGDMRTAVVEVPHPWTTSLAGDPRQRGLFPERAPAEEGHLRDMGVLVPAPDAPDDPRCGGERERRRELCLCVACVCARAGGGGEGSGRLLLLLLLFSLLMSLLVFAGAAVVLLLYVCVCVRRVSLCRVMLSLSTHEISV